MLTLRFIAQSKIPLERSTEEHETRPFSAAYVAEHMRQPVYFNHAVQRLATQFPQAIWLEAGSNSTITTMANKALGMPESSVFQAINVTSSTSALQQLSNATMSLWKAGLRAQFWPHSRKQTYQYAPIILPPYQFEKSRHWLEFKTPLENLVSDELSPDKTDSFEVKPLSTHLHTPLDPGDDDKERYRFRINTQMEEFIDVVSGQLSSL
jgi:acyl transferase domain-containing protein